MPRIRHVLRGLAGSHGGRRELAVFAVAYLTYFGVRAVTEGHTARAFHNARDVIAVERRLGLDHEYAVQSLVTGSNALSDATNAIYIYGHWPVLITSGVLLFHHRRAHYRMLRDACLISGLVGLFVFALFPVAPPRLMDLPVVDLVTRGSPGYRQLFPPSLVNQYAAMPSFHVGWNLLVGIVVFRATKNPLLRVFAVVMPVAMGFAVIATANHFVLDVLVGAAIVVIALHVAQVIESRRDRLTLDRHDRGLHAGAGGSDDNGGAVRDRPPSRERPPAPAVG
jgi:hypothetical protein